MGRLRRARPRFPATVAAASAFFLGAGAFTLAIGLGWLGTWFDGSLLVRALAVAEGLFLIGLGLLPPILWLLSRSPSARPRGHGHVLWPVEPRQSQLRELVR